jgi:hypothetical protein
MMNRNRPAMRIGLKLGLGTIGLAFSAVIAGCGAQKNPLQVAVTQLGPYNHAAKGPDCHMPILEALPANTGSQIAIVEAWADQTDAPPDVLPALRRKACETGADALVIINSQHQDIKHLLYSSDPETMVEQQKESGYAQQQGDSVAINDAGHARAVGEEGHNGFYIDAVAIEYDSMDDKHASEPLPPPVVGSVRTPPG